MHSGLERIEHILEGNDAFGVFGIMQALHNGRNDVASRTPDGAFDASESRSPEPGILAPPLADGEEQLMHRYLFCTLNGAGNLRILDRTGPLLLCTAAPVDLDIIEAPFRKLQEILCVMPLATALHVLRARVGVRGATATTCVRVNSALQGQALKVIG